jgi:hypothetical protein
MKTQLQTSKFQAEYGIRWMLAALLILGAMGSAHAADRKSCNATLHISVTVMPIVQAQALAQSTKEEANTSSVAYRLQPVAVRQTREVRNISIETKAHRDAIAVLQTVTTVAD